MTDIMKQIGKVEYKDRYNKSKSIRVYLWGNGDLSLSYEDKKDEGTYFVLSNASRKRLIKLLQKVK